MKLSLQNSSRLCRSMFFFILATISVSTAGAAHSTGENWWNHLYLSLSGGGHTRSRAAESDVIWTDWDPGYSINGALGYRFESHFRFEVEASGMNNQADVVSGGLGPGGVLLVGPGAGEATLRAIMFNAYFDFPIEGTRFTPYVGGGAGFFKSYVDDLTNPTIQPFGFIFTGNSKETFAFQLRAGVAYSLSDRWEIYTGYRYFDGDKLTFVFNLPNGLSFPAAPKETRIHSGEIGIRFNF